jgi:hypothetical protein
MKQIYIWAVLLMGILTGCGSSKKDSKEETQRMFQLESVDENTGLQRMQVSRVNQEISCRGKKFQLSVERTPDEELPHVKSNMGLFVDNSIKVKITRDNGTPLFEKTFTKNDFASSLSAKYLKHSVLEGLVFDDVRTAEKKEITLAASVSYPMTDLYIPFILVVSQDGKLSISKDEDMGEMTFLEEQME